jgi:hypothetical protein
MSYVIAAYGLVIGTLVLYGIRVQVQRRELARAERAHSESFPDR